jgi:hypothetical protein
LGRSPRGRDVRDPAHERAGAVHQQGNAAAGVRDARREGGARRPSWRRTSGRGSSSR